VNAVRSASLEAYLLRFSNTIVSVTYILWMIAFPIP